MISSWSCSSRCETVLMVPKVPEHSISPRVTSHFWRNGQDMCASTLGVSQPANAYILLSVQREKTALHVKVVNISQHFNSFVRFFYMISITFFNAIRILPYSLCVWLFNITCWITFNQGHISDGMYLAYTELGIFATSLTKVKHPHLN